MEKSADQRRYPTRIGSPLSCGAGQEHLHIWGDDSRRSQQLHVQIPHWYTILNICISFTTQFISTSMNAIGQFSFFQKNKSKLILACVTMLYSLFADKCRWVLMKFEGDMPPNRLDHSMCLLPWKVCDEGKDGEEKASSSAASETTLAFVFGGMDTQGVIHNDCIVTVVT